MKVPTVTAKYRVIGVEHTDPYTEGREVSAFTWGGVRAAAQRLSNAGFRTVTVKDRNLIERVRLMPPAERRLVRARREREHAHTA